MRQYILSFFILFLHHFVFAQNEMIDSLKTALNNTKTDTAKLRIYLSMNKACNKKDKLLYAEPALLLVDKLLSKETNKQKRHKLIDQEKALLNSVGEYYRGRNTADWNKAMTYFQSRLQSIEKKGDLKRTATFLYTMAGISIDEKKDSSLFRSYILRSLSVSKAIEDSALVVDAYSFMTAFYGSAGNYTEALGAAQSSISFCKKLNYEKGLARSYRSLAGLYQGFGEDEAALEYFQTAINLAQKIRDTVQICYALQSLGNFYNQQKNIKKAVEYFEQLQKLSTDYNNPSISQGNILRNFGYTYLNNNDPINALRHFEESLKIFENEKDYSYISLVLMDIGSVYNKQGDFERALSYNTHAIHILDSINDPFQFKSYLLYCQAKDYYGLKNYAKAKEINDNSKDDFKRDWFDLDGRIEIELLAFRIDSALGDGFGALAHYKEYSLLNEQMKGDEVKKEAQKENFKAEMEKQKLEQEKKDAIAKRTRNLQYIVILAFLLLGVFLLYGYNQKNKANKLLEKSYSDLKSTQSQLIQSEKMASLGELTAGIAHEIQNPLNFVNNFSDVSNELIKEMKEEFKKGDVEEGFAIADDIEQNLEKINYHGQRASDIVKGMLEHSRKSSGEKVSTNINIMCDEYLKLAYHGYRAKDKSFYADFELKVDENFPKIKVIPQDIGRVILNLINNAFYAVNERHKLLNLAQSTSDGNRTDLAYKPKVTITTQDANNLAIISIKDNGSGIPEHLKDKIFQPFFTTKPTGQGTGLGLSLSYDIVKAHGGELKVETKEGEGSEFIINLPIS